MEGQSQEDPTEAKAAGGPGLGIGRDWAIVKTEPACEENIEAAEVRAEFHSSVAYRLEPCHSEQGACEDSPSPVPSEDHPAVATPVTASVENDIPEVDHGCQNSCSDDESEMSFDEPMMMVPVKIENEPPETDDDDEADDPGILHVIPPTVELGAENDEVAPAETLLPEEESPPPDPGLSGYTSLGHSLDTDAIKSEEMDTVDLNPHIPFPTENSELSDVQRREEKCDSEPATGIQVDTELCKDGERFAYERCAEYFSEDVQLKIDLSSSHTGESIHPCTLCTKTFARSSFLKRHMRTHTGEKPYQCYVCSKAFSQSTHLTIHMRCHTGEKPYQCPVCPKSFSQSGPLNAHMHTHTGEKPYPCAECTKWFTRSCDLNTHMRTHTGEKPYKCTLCSKAFSQSANLTAHMHTHTGEKPYPCSLCSKSFCKPGRLDSHMHSHTGDKPIKCLVCSKTFSWQNELNIHMRSHTGEKPYQCPVCSKSFSRTNHLSTHMRIHTGEKPYQCSHCSKSFATSTQLVSHMRSHTGEKPHQCTSCTKSFSTSSDLTRHVRTHTGEKPFQCKVCSKFFSRSTSLTSHIHIHSRENRVAPKQARILPRILPK